MNFSLLPRKILVQMQTKTGGVDHITVNYARLCDFLKCRKSRSVQLIRCRIFQPARAPEEKDRRENDQLHDRGSDDAADHRRGDAFHHVRARAVAPQDRQQGRR